TSGVRVADRHSPQGGVAVVGRHNRVVDHIADMAVARLGRHLDRKSVVEVKAGGGGISTLVGSANGTIIDTSLVVVAARIDVGLRDGVAGRTAHRCWRSQR